MSIAFKYGKCFTKITDPQQSPPIASSICSKNSHPELTIQSEPILESSIYETFFHYIQHPGIIVDMNINMQKTIPHIMNVAAKSLIESADDVFTLSHMETFDGSLGEFLASARRKVVQEINHSDILHIKIKSRYENIEAVFSFSASSFYLDVNTKMLGILLVEITKTVKEEINALNTFKGSLISALSHEFNNPLNSLIPLLKMMPNCYNDKKENIKEMALASAAILQNKIGRASCRERVYVLV